MKEKNKFKKEYEDFRFAKDMVTIFRGKANKCVNESAPYCVFFQNTEDMNCRILDRDNCLGCSFHRTTKVPAFIERKESKKRRTVEVGRTNGTHIATIETYEKGDSS